MRKMNVTLSAFLCVATIAWAGSAAALNPQPEPPNPQTPNAKLHSTQFEPPGPCVKTQTIVAYKDGEDGVNRTRPGNHKPTAMACTHNGSNIGPHRLNPQPLPPG
jgi:hypothetical protein